MQMKYATFSTGLRIAFSEEDSPQEILSTFGGRPDLSMKDNAEEWLTWTQQEDLESCKTVLQETFDIPYPLPTYIADTPLTMKGTQDLYECLWEIDVDMPIIVGICIAHQLQYMPILTCRFDV